MVYYPPYKPRVTFAAYTHHSYLWPCVQDADSDAEWGREGVDWWYVGAEETKSLFIGA